MASKFEIVLQATLDKAKSKAQIDKDIEQIEKGLNVNLNLKADSKSANQIKSAINGIGKSAQEANGHLQNLGDIANKFSRWQVIGDVIHGIKDGIQDMVQQVFDLDESLTELDKVTDLSSAGLQQLADDAFEVGEKIGATGKDVIDATTIFAQAGYEAKDALDLGEQAIMLQNVSEAGATAEGSANTLIAAMKAFKLEASDSSHVVDALNEVSNKYAVSVNDLSTGITKASASMAAGNNSLEQTFGLVAAGTEILRQPGRVANGLSTITARLTQKNDEYIKSITKGQGVIDEQTGELRSTFDILQDLSKAWENLNSVEKQELTETVAGKTQRALFTAIMTNFDTAVGATEAALNSEGSALEENNKRMDSLQGRLKQLDSAWQSFSRNTINSEWVKNILNATTELIKFTDKIGGLPVVLAAATSALMLFKGGLILDKSFKIFNSGLDLIKNGITTLVTALPNAISAFRAFSAGIISAGTAIQAAVPLLSVIALAITGVVAGINAFTKAQEEATAAAIEDSQEASKIIENKTKQKETIEDEIKKLKEEKDAYINSAKAKGKDTNNDEWIKSKDEEISKRQENIEKINQEIKKQLEQREAAARSITFKKADKSGLGQGNIFANVSGEDYNKYIEIMDKGNEKLKEAGTNTGAYNRILEEYRAEINKTIKEKEDSNQSTHAETEAIKEINKELERNSKKYEEDAKSAEELYDILKSGGTISQEQINWLEKFYNLNDEQINQLKTGIDVLNDTTTATENQTNATSNLTEEQQNLLDKSNDVTEAIKSKNEAIDKEQESYNTLKSAVDEYNESGYLSIDTLQSLLSLDDEHLAMLSLQNGQLALNTSSIDDMTNALISQRVEQLQTAATQDLYNLSIGNMSGLSSTAQTAINNLKNDVSNTKTEMANAIPTMTQYNQKLREAAQLYGVNTGEYKDEAGAIIKQYEDIYKKITTLGSSTSRAGGTSGDRHRYTGSSKSKKSGSKSSKETYKAEVDTLYKYENALDNAKDAVDRLNDALSNTDNFNEREKYLKQLIEATRKEIDATNDLRDAQTRQINDYINQLRRQGFQISYNSKTNELNINNMERLGKFSGDTAKNLEKMIKKIQDLNKDNRSLSGSIRDLNSDIEDFNDQLNKLPEEKLKKFNELMEEFQQSRLDQIQNQIEDIQHEMENDPRLKALEAQIEALEKQNDELDSQKELEEKILAVEEAKEKLANQRKQKTIQIYREGQGFVWEADIDAIQDAADELKDAQDELNDKIKQDQLDQLNAEKEALENSYQNRIDALQDFLDNQNYLIDKANREGIKTFEELQKQMAQFGLDNAENLKKATDWLNNYNQSLSDLNKTVSGILSSSTTATDGLIYSSETQDRINNALSSIIPNIDTSTGLTLSNVRTEATNKDATSSIYINSIELPNVKDIDDFIKALKDLPRMASSQSTLRV